MKTPLRYRTAILVLLTMAGLAVLAACSGSGTTRVGVGFGYGGYYGHGPYWGRGGVYVDAPIIVGPPIDDTPIAVPLPEYDYDDIWN